MNRGQRSGVRGQAGIVKAFVLMFVCLLVACGGQNGYVTQTQQVEGIAIGFESPETAILLENYDLFVTLTDEAGKPIDGADVVMDLDMPAMPMGENRPVADPLGNGRYQVSTAYSMDGDWIITVEVEIDGQQRSAVFTQNVTPSAP